MDKHAILFSSSIAIWKANKINGYLNILFFVIAALALGQGIIAQSPNSVSGYPTRSDEFDVYPGFKNPPAGYGQIPFWWWTGEPLKKDRLLYQIEELHRKGVSGMQVNYSHKDTPGFPTDTMEPEIFSAEWWDIWNFVVKECAKREMGIGLSGYTIDWPNGNSLFSRTIYSDPEIQGREIKVSQKVPVQSGELVTVKLPDNMIGIRAYPVKGSRITAGGIDLSVFVDDGKVVWKPDHGRWEIWVFTAPRKPGTLNPIHPDSGKRVIERFFQRFEDNAGDSGVSALNYFFQDELKFGVGDIIWTDDFNAMFRHYKGYDVFEVLPALFVEIGPKTSKARLDFMDVKVQLQEDRYFKPIYEWHRKRGLIYACDSWGRGRDPGEFGDYFRSVRWYTTPGHDTPRGKADLIKGKVSSSIAHLYKLPRVWLEGYHSLGWSASPEQLMFATRENFLYGCTLLNLHGLYYTTYGGYWEWAPPCYHFRMPYWEHMDVFFKYFERLSYLLSHGVHQSDIAILYPVSPYQAKMDGPKAASAAFSTGEKLFQEGYDFIFIDDQSLEHSEIVDGKLLVAEAAYRVLVLPSMRAIRWSSLKKVQQFIHGGGSVIAVDMLPEASDRAGSEDSELDTLVSDIFGFSAAQAKAGVSTGDPQLHASGGMGLLAKDAQQVVETIGKHLVRSVDAEKKVRSQHRKIGARDVYMVMDAAKGSACTFRCTGRPELWDPWTGKTEPLTVLRTAVDSTTVAMPLEAYEAQIVVFSPDSSAHEILKRQNERKTVQKIEGPWTFELKPTLDNRWGDFRLPLKGSIIGAEARQFYYEQQTQNETDWHTSDLDVSQWPKITYGFGQKFWKLGPLPTAVDLSALEEQLAELDYIDPAKAVQIGRISYTWQPYTFSWRWGVEGDPGHQGYHGLKKNVSDDFICLGKQRRGIIKPFMLLKMSAAAITCGPVRIPTVIVLSMYARADSRRQQCI